MFREVFLEFARELEDGENEGLRTWVQFAHGFYYLRSMSLNINVPISSWGLGSR